MPTTNATTPLLDYLKQNDKALVFMIMAAGAVTFRHGDSQQMSDEILEMAETSLAMLRFLHPDTLKELLTLFSSTMTSLATEAIS